MSAKAPVYLKRGSRRGKKEKLRDVLSSDMISPPLGDFRHTIHIGSGSGANDLFGDLSFLQGKFHLLPSGQARSLSQRSHPRPASVCGNPPFPSRSHLLKNAISLPIIGGVRALALPTSARPQAPPPKPPRLHLDNKTTAPPIPSKDPSPNAQQRAPEDRLQERAYLPHASSLLSLHLDLGPSILDDVLQIMDKQCVGLNGACLHGGRQGILT